MFYCGFHVPTGEESRIPVWIKWGFTGFMLVLVPVYGWQYGPTNFLYFCDLALFLTLYGVWTGKALPIGMVAVGIVLVQMIWCLDFGSSLLGHRLTGTAA